MGADRQIDLLDGDFYVNDPYPTYKWMRENAPAYWDATNELWGICLLYTSDAADE